MNIDREQTERNPTHLTRSNERSAMLMALVALVELTWLTVRDQDFKNQRKITTTEKM